MTHMHDEYPLDGSVTKRADYEAVCPTGTVGEYLTAQKRLAANDHLLPPDFGAYLKARIPSTRHLSELPNATRIDQFGRTHGT